MHLLCVSHGQSVNSGLVTCLLCHAQVQAHDRLCPHTTVPDYCYLGRFPDIRSQPPHICDTIFGQVETTPISGLVFGQARFAVIQCFDNLS